MTGTQPNGGKINAVLFSTAPFLLPSSYEGGEGEMLSAFCSVPPFLYTPSAGPFVSLTLVPFECTVRLAFRLAHTPR